MRTLGILGPITVVVLAAVLTFGAAALLPFSTAEATHCTPDKYGKDPDCPATAYCPHTQCLRCVSIQGTDNGDGGKSEGCEECGPYGRCTGCAPIRNCAMHPSRFKNYQKKSIEPDLGIVQERGGILKQTKP